MKEHDPMSAAFGLAVLVTALAGVAAVLSSRVSERLRIPAPAFFLIAAAAAADLWPRLGGLSFTAVENVVSVALAVILFDGGMRVGWRRLRPVAGPTLWIGVAGTLVTAGGVAAAAAHGSGFLAVFVAGLVIGDERAPYQREIARFHSALASLAEIVAFAILGLTIQLHKLAHDWAWLAGLVLAVLLSLVIRPLLVGLLLWPVRLRPGERICVLWAGLKGAVPILLGAFIVRAGAAGAHRLYEIIFVVVTFSVIRRPRRGRIEHVVHRAAAGRSRAARPGALTPIFIPGPRHGHPACTPGGSDHRHEAKHHKTVIASPGGHRRRHAGGPRVVCFGHRGPSGFPGSPAGHRADTQRDVDSRCGQVIAGPSGKPVTLPGRSYLLITLHPAQAHSAGAPTIARSVQATGYPVLKGYALAGDFEGVLTLALGLQGPTSIRVGELPGHWYIDLRQARLAARVRKAST
jgi:hypothetical protein